jgi:hypothetical protein
VAGGIAKVSILHDNSACFTTQLHKNRLQVLSSN